MQGQKKGPLRKEENIHKLKAADLVSLSQFRKSMYEEQHYVFRQSQVFPKLQNTKHMKK